LNKKNIYLFYAIALFQGMVFYAPVATLYRQSRGIGIFQITLIESISLALCLALEIPWGFVADKIGYKKTILICNLLYFASKIVFWKANGFAMFLVERLMLSVVMSGLSGCDSAFLYISAGKDDAPRVFGIYSAMGTAGLLTASAVFSLFLRDDYALSGLLTVFSYGVSLVLTLFSTEVENNVENPKSFYEQIKELLTVLKSGRQFLLFFNCSSTARRMQPNHYHILKSASICARRNKAGVDGLYLHSCHGRGTFCRAVAQAG